MPSRVGLAKIIIVLVIFFVLGSFQQSHDVYAYPGLDDPLPIRDWDKETVEGSKDIGRYPSLSVDPGGNPHIGYYDTTNSDIRYTFWAGESWIRETVDHINTDFISLTLDGTKPHMLFGKQRLVYAFRTSTGWQTETIDVGSSSAFRSGTLALDAAGYPHISYYDYDNETFNYARRTSSGWVIEHFLEQVFVRSSTSITIDQSGNPHIGFVASNVLNYAHYADTGWVIEQIDTGQIRAASIMLDNSDQPHISYIDLGKDEIKYARKLYGSWQIETVEFTAVDLDSLTSLALSSTGVPHISYYDDDLKTLKVANREVGSWSSELVEDAAGVGEFSSLVFDKSDTLHIAYHDASLKAVKYGRRTSAGWEIQIVHLTMGAGESFSMVLDMADYPHLVYDAGWYGNLAIRYTRKTTQGWIYETVDHSSWIRQASIVLDSKESPHISFFNDQTAEFIYAWRSENGWITETVDTNGHYRGINALAVNNQDEPRLAYFVETGFNQCSLRFASRTTSGWITQTLKSEISGGPTGISMRMDQANRPHLAYELAGIWYSWYDGTIWKFEQVETYSAGKVSLALDSSDDAHISFQNNYNLMYTNNKSGNWSTETVDDSQDTGFNSSLALDNDDVPHISYYDRGNLTYMYASQTADGWFIESVLKVPVSVSVIQPDTVLNLDSAGKPRIATSTLNFLTNIMQILSGGELYVPHWVYLPAIYR